MEGLVSVIIPVYNVLPYLREALDSVISQTYANLEIIIVDDGSTDGSGAVCDRYASDSRVRVIHQENRGLSRARNAGLNIMTGDYTAFLDPDDAFAPEMIERLLHVLIAEHADLVSCGYDVYETEGLMRNSGLTETVKPAKDAVLTAKEAFDVLLDGRYTVSVWNKLYRSSIWAQLRFPEGVVYEDFIAAPYVLEQCERIAAVSQALVLHRRRNGSITQTGTVENIRDLIHAYSQLQEYLEKEPASFPPESIRISCEQTTRSMILDWAKLRKRKAPEDVSDCLKAEIFRYKKKTGRFRKFKSSVIWMLFRCFPGLLLPASACLQRMRKHLGMGNGVIA